MVGGDEDVRGVRVGQPLDQVHQIAQRVVGGLEHLPLGGRLVADCVDPVVVDVQHLVCTVEFAQLTARHRQHFLGPDREPTHWSQDLVAVRSSVGTLVVNEHGIATMGVGQGLVWKQGRHA